MNPDFTQILQGSSVDLNDGQLAQLWAHWALIKDWNQRVNLTSIQNDVQSAWLHYRDSLAVVDYLPEGPIIDMGSGSGFPGIPLAVACPDREFYLVEPRRKRVSFLRVAVGRLKLLNVRVLHGRSSDRPPKAFAGLVTRATFSREEDLHPCLRWLRPNGTLIAFRSESSDGLGLTNRSITYEVGDHKRRLEFIDRDALESSVLGI